MALFLGKYRYEIDEKGRVSIPARFRKLMSQEPDQDLGTIKGMDGCIFVYPAKTLEAFQANFDRSQFKSEADARRFQRLLADGGAIAQPDAQGRITLTEEERRHAGLKKEVVIFGNFERIEIWDPERLEEHLNGPGDQREQIDDLAGKFFR
jgi:MraZ protein